MDRDWKRLGSAIKARREELGMSTQQELADKAGVTRQSVSSLESGKTRSRMPQSISAIERALDWEAGKAARLLATPAGTREQQRFADGMPARVARELSTGQVVDTEVLDLTLPGSSSRIVVVFKQDSDAASMSEDELRAELEQFSRIQRAVRQIAAEPNPPEAHEA